MEQIEVIAKNCKYYRLAKGLSISEAAQMSGISAVTISKVENGKIEDAKISTINKLASIYDCQIDELLCQKSLFLDSNDEGDELVIQNDMHFFYPYYADDVEYDLYGSEVTSLMEFLVYLPLIEEDKLMDIYANRIQESFIGYEHYIVVNKLSNAISAIPDGDAKEYARLTVEAMRKVRLTRELVDGQIAVAKIDEKYREAYSAKIQNRYEASKAYMDSIKAYVKGITNEIHARY